MIKKESYPKNREPKAITHSPNPSPLLPQHPPLDIWVDKCEIMKEFKISERTLFNLRKKNEIPHARLGKLILYNRTKLEERLRKHSGLMVLVAKILLYYVQDVGIAAEL